MMMTTKLFSPYRLSHGWLRTVASAGNRESNRLRGEGLEQALASLDERSRRIIEARWLREKDTATLHDLADELGVSAERVRQIEAKALQKMRLAITAAA